MIHREDSVSEYKEISFETFENELLWPVTDFQTRNKYISLLRQIHPLSVKNGITHIFLFTRLQQIYSSFQNVCLSTETEC